MFKRRSERLDGWVEQAFEFKLDPSAAVGVLIRRHVGMRRKAHNWAVGVIKSQVELFGLREEAGLNVGELRVGKARRVNPLFTLAGLRKLWNRVKDGLCVDADTGRRWWRDLSKEAAANGIADAVSAYWDWVASRKGTRKGPRLGFPKFKKKGRGAQSFRIGTGTIKLTDRSHIQLPRLGVVRLAENARRLDRLVGKGMARIKSVTVSERADGFYVSLQVELLRPQRHHEPLKPDSKVGIDLGSRWLAVVASVDGTILERVPNPAALKEALKTLRRLQRKLARSRRVNPDGSNRQTELRLLISQTHADVAAVRRDAMHKLTTRLAKTHGVIVIEDLNVKGMMKKSGLPGGKTRRRALNDAALGEFRRQLTYKTKWYGSELIVADRWFPSSQTCHVCHHRQKIKWAAKWTCGECGSVHDRDDNAAVNLARYEPDQKGGWVQEGPRQSCCCGVCSPGERTERLRDDKTDPAPTTPTRVGQVTRPGCAAVSLMREEQSLFNPARGA